MSDWTSRYIDWWLAGREVAAGQDVLDETLVDAHLVAVPGLGALTAGGLAGGDLEGLGGQADGALDAQVLALGALDQLGADLLEGLDLAGGEGDADLVGLGGLKVALLALLVRHFEMIGSCKGALTTRTV